VKKKPDPPPKTYFGNLPLAKNDFSLVIGAIIIISILPGVVELQQSGPSRI